MMMMLVNPPFLSLSLCRSFFGEISEEEEYFRFGELGEERRSRQSKHVSVQSAGE